MGLRYSQVLITPRFPAYEILGNRVAASKLFSEAQELRTPAAHLPCKPMLDTNVIVLAEVIDAENEPDYDDNPTQPHRRKYSRNPSTQ